MFSRPEIFIKASNWFCHFILLNLVSRFKKKIMEQKNSTVRLEMWTRNLSSSSIHYSDSRSQKKSALLIAV